MYVEKKKLAKEQSVIQRSSLLSSVVDNATKITGMNFSDVSWFRNSSEPAKYNAHSYATGGNEIHTSSGRDNDLFHEVGHLKAQKENRVSSTGTISGRAVNDNPALEAEADNIGNKIKQSI